MLPTDYKFTIQLSELDSKEYTFIQSDYDIEFWLNFVSFPVEFRDDITGIVVCVYEGDLYAMWLSESAAPYSIYANYHPLPFYKPDKFINQPHLPVYWSEDNFYYRR